MKKLILILTILLIATPAFAIEKDTFSVYYNPNDGRIFDCVYYRDSFAYDPADNFNDRVLLIYSIDEVDPNNKALCKDLVKHGKVWLVDSNGDNKYYISGDPAELYERDGWVQEVPE